MVTWEPRELKVIAHEHGAYIIFSVGTYLRENRLNQTQCDFAVYPSDVATVFCITFSHLQKKKNLNALLFSQALRTIQVKVVDVSFLEIIVLYYVSCATFVHHASQLAFEGKHILLSRSQEMPDMNNLVSWGNRHLYLAISNNAVIDDTRWRKRLCMGKINATFYCKKVLFARIVHNFVKKESLPPL